jgi:hypothetical protein
VSGAYNGVGDQIRQQFLGTTGGGGSGKYGTAVLASSLGRAGGLAGADVAAAARKSQLQQSTAGLATNELGLNFGETYAGQQQQANSSDFTQSGKGSGTGFGIGSNFGWGGSK